ncbi:hypothetical protein CPB97_001360 [Podila verticillata]|nr:hypothetical protein CPB97_001360 [Podila verticillata]
MSYSPELNVIHISLLLCRRRLREELFCARVSASYNLVIDIRFNNGGMHIRLLNISGDFVPYTHAKLISLDTTVRNMTTIIPEISAIDIEAPAPNLHFFNKGRLEFFLALTTSPEPRVDLAMSFPDLILEADPA